MDDITCAMPMMCGSISQQAYNQKGSAPVRINGQAVDFDRVVIVGRSGEISVYANLCIVSRRHLHVLADRGGNLWIRDNCSKLGTYVNGLPIPTEGWFRLLPTDKVTLGNVLPLEIAR